MNKRGWLLVTVFTLAFIWINIDIQRNEQCVAGFPIAFYDKCEGGSFSQNFFMGGAVIDFLFWFLLSFFFLVVLKTIHSKRFGKWKYLLAPAFVVLMSFWYNTPCGGFICLFSGRGFPLPFFVDNHWLFLAFIIDFLVWAVVLYPMICGAVWVFQKMLK